ncbi:MAG: ATP-dependent DNA helicase RecG [Candidatus Sulfobium sp.]
MDSSPEDRPIESERGIGPGKSGILARIGITTVGDALYYLPFRYQDRSLMGDIRDLRAGTAATVRGRIISSANRRVRGRGTGIYEMLVDDGTGTIAAKWFNQPFLQRNFRAGQEVILSGTISRDRFRGCNEILNAEYEIIRDGADSFIHTNRIVPFYRLTEGISQKQFRKIMFGIVDGHTADIDDPLPPDIVRRNGLAPLRESLRQVHFPGAGADPASLERGDSPYHRRLVFQEFFIFELGMAMRKKSARSARGIVFDCGGRLGGRLLETLPFGLTAAQKRVIEEVRADMKRQSPMHRLLKGDVGSGKTVVALMAMLYAVECGYQAALMAPTQTLAVQHYATIRGMTGGLGLKTLLLAGGAGDTQREPVAAGEARIVIGTHALIQEGVEFRKLGLCVIDEQHKFGVMQRSRLAGKGIRPDVLVMTATPIPRSLALTLYGDLDCSVIDELPPDRRPVATEIVRPGEKARIYGLLEREIGKGRQAYVVYPVIEGSDKTDLKSASEGKEAFEKIFPRYTVALLHGRMGPGEREDVMASFRGGKIDILVTTTVVEVGVDVPNATVMLVVHAERFGLAQLHQLRGRVGRGAEKSHCLLVSDGGVEGEAGRRLNAMAASADGFRIAEEDLAIRGPGEFFGTRQAGMPELKVADIIRHAGILEAAREEAFRLIEAAPGLGKFPLLKKAVQKYWRGTAALRMTG